MPESSSLLDGFRSLITPDVVSRASSTFGESEIAVNRGLGVLVPTVFGTIANNADNRGFMSHLFDMMRDPAVDNNISNTLGSGISSQPTRTLGSRFMSMLFGSNTSTLGTAVSNYSGLKASTTLSMLGMAGPLVLGYLGNMVRRQGLDMSGLSSMLLGQKNAIMSMLPSTFSSFARATTDVGETAYRTAETEVRKPSAWRWVFVVLLGLLMLWGLSSMLRRRAITPLPTDIGSAASAVGDFISRSLPTGVNLKYLRSGIEGRLLSFIENPSASVNTESWFDFDRLLFETGSPVLKPESRDQLRNIAEILKAYPNVHVKVGGYTDSSGDPAANLQLSQARANTVMQELSGLGISSSRLAAEGYGQNHPIASNATQEGRAQNRRVALLVTAK
jgi:outer membrane protein OmpA-like peptidoglycan-associated protein